MSADFDEIAAAILKAVESVESRCGRIAGKDRDFVTDHAALIGHVAIAGNERFPSDANPPDKYRALSDECLKWAREAPTEEIRLACLHLARCWLEAAMREDSAEPAFLPLAPTLNDDSAAFA